MKARSLLAVLTLVLAFAMNADVAFARTANDYPYPVDKVWNASLRLVRVDLGCSLGDRDTDAGYFMFDYVDGGRRYPGSLEIVRSQVEGRDGVHVVVQIPAMPAYVERMILDRLARKLVDDFGEPAPPPPQPRHDDHTDRDARSRHNEDEDTNERRSENDRDERDADDGNGSESTRGRSSPARSED